MKQTRKNLKNMISFLGPQNGKLHSKFLKSEQSVIFPNIQNLCRLNSFLALLSHTPLNGFFLRKYKYQKTLLGLAMTKTHGELPYCLAPGCKTNVTVHFSEQTDFCPRRVNMTLNKQQLAGLGVVNCSMNHI